ncbi:armadillo-type protein [Aspergillus nidulans var. acristatus]
MASTQAPAIFEDAPRSPTKPSVLRALLGHRRNQSADDAARSMPYTSGSSSNSSPVEQQYPPSNQQPLGEITPNGTPDGMFYPGSPNKSGKGLHKKTKSAVSLKSLKNYIERKPEKTADDPSSKPKKAKSTNSFTAILKRSQHGRKSDEVKDGRDKENRSPSDPADNIPSPVWMQYGTPTHSFRDESSPANSNRRRTLQEEVSLYTPKGYGPAQQRNFYDYHQPSLSSRTNVKPRPKSDFFASGSKVKDLLGPFQGLSPSKQSLVDQQVPASKMECGRPRGLSTPDARSETESRQASPKKPSRVQEVISAFNAKEREAELQKRLNSKDLESEFEKLLDARNIPHNMRDKMRSLDTNIKVDFIQKDKLESTTPHSAASTYPAESTGRRGRGKDKKEEHDSYDSKGSRSRSRSRGFTFSRGNSSSPTKKRPESGSSHRRPKSIDLSAPGLSKILTPNASTTSLAVTARRDTATDPSDFVHYLKEIQKPEIIEVGKIHKLRILLRNETVSWVDSFIAEGGMDEIVQLVYRIMKVEWREEHEDNLLHETLLCLKALCTTSVALQRLTDIEAELFPALLGMLFDKEKKGPSEFTTRGIIINLIFTQLSTAASAEDGAARTTRILSYLRDPPEENQPLSFIANIYQSRPYRVWCKEISNVTKEVFWIFLHHLNVIPVVQTDKSLGSYRERHFPAPRPPVPAAPYVGGVEWDATNYLAAHIDLINGLIASLPTIEERNNLRKELRASGFEKVMGATLRTCKEKFYSSVHDCLRTWVSAAVEDGWPHLAVREGPPRQEASSPTRSPVKSPNKKGGLNDLPPKLDLKIDIPVGGGGGGNRQGDPIGDWL